MKERWKLHPEGRYAVSTLGRIKQVAKSRCRNVGIVNTHRTSCGYYVVTLFLGGRWCSISAHKFIAELYFGPRPPGKQVNHKNGNKADNKPKNLEYTTPSRNTLHAWKNGLCGDRNGSKNPHAVLSSGQVDLIRLLAKRYRRMYLAKRFNVSLGTIRRVILGITYSASVEV